MTAISRIALALTSVCVLSGCAPGGNYAGMNAGSSNEGILGGYMGSYSAPAGDPSSLQTPVPPSRALAFLPASAGPVVSVLETRRSNAVMQEIVLAGDHATAGENKINVTALVPPDLSMRNGGDPIKLAPPTDITIENELGEKFPSIAMHLSATYDRNGQGPFGFAIGHPSPVTTCIYAWQYIGPNGPISLFDGASGRAPQPVSVRVRLCAAQTTEQALVDTVRQMVVMPPGPSYGGFMPVPMGMAPAYGAPDALTASGSLGASSASLMPAYPAMAPAALPQPASRAMNSPPLRRHRVHAERHMRHRRSVAQAADDTRVEPLAPGSAVPLPGEIAPPMQSSNRMPMMSRPVVRAAPVEDTLPLPN